MCVHVTFRLNGAWSEDAARELFARYFVKSETSRCSPQDLKCSLESLCRWTAVLRNELTSAREKARNYRIELSRLRKMHATAAQRAARSETLASQRNEQIQALEEQLSLALNRSRPTSCTERLEDVRSNSEVSEHPTSPDLLATPEQRFSSKNLQRSAQLNTPDLISLSPTTCPSTSDLQRRLRTPAENPFRAKINSTNRLELTVSSTIASALDDHRLFPEVSRADFSNPDPKLKYTKPSFVQRRPSVLYEMAIMRRHLVTSGEHAVSLASHVVSTSTFTPRSAVTASACHSQKTATCNTKRSVNVSSKKPIGPSVGAKLSRLDAFVLRR
ncbi:hypothetical protein D915_006249 [Fasciola hepatica]|uniref:Uncharacterized protein n=1 Tax=Fasciola hepatica TaxID=6192 RepID=A0A4E0RQQ4_FASHE|nr:hypothetical protein D915_006249 [Fasciola hepatica]